jgi:hypothetical protein
MNVGVAIQRKSDAVTKDNRKQSVIDGWLFAFPKFAEVVLTTQFIVDDPGASLDNDFGAMDDMEDGKSLCLFDLISVC